MLQNLYSSEFYKTMDLFKEIDEFNELFLFEKNPKLESEVEEYEDLQSKYSSLHETYSKEIENSKKVEKCLLKCLKFYSKLCKKYELQQKIIVDLKEDIKEKINSLEEAQRNEVKLKGLIQIYRTERTLYTGQTNAQLKKDKELLLEICCKLIGDSVKNYNTRSATNLLLRKFKNDLSDEKLNLLTGKGLKLKDELDLGGDLKPDITAFKSEMEFKSEDKYSNEMTKVEVKEQEDDIKNHPLDLSFGKVVEDEGEEEEEDDELEEVEEAEQKEKEESSCLVDEDSKQGCDNEKRENFPEMEKCSERALQKEDKPKDSCTVNNQNRINLDLMDSEDESFPYENELSMIFREMSSIRVLSPLRESKNSPVDHNINELVVQNVIENHEEENAGSGLKRNSDAEENSCKNKKLKQEGERPSCGLLDSIMSAMSLQNEEFKSSGCPKKEANPNPNAEAGGSSPSRFRSLGTRTYSRLRKLGDGGSRERTNVCQSPGSGSEKQQTVEKIVADEIKNFVSSPISSKEDADKNVKRCISALSNKSEDVIAKCIVAVLLENVDEPVEIFERPAPPLTKTQHRLVVLLSVFQNFDPNSEKISTKILSLISEKLFPDNFFWPDDSIEAVVRFYAALCRARNDPKTLWRFCLNAMTEMRQRCPLLMFTVLKTWPDVLHDASTLKNNMLAVTIVNIFLHMSRTEGLRNFNQGRKLVALKHLLLNFYQFKVEETIEGYSARVLDAVCRGELGSEKSIVLLAKCRDQSWTAKNLVPSLTSRLTDWFEGKLEDPVAGRILSVMKRICPLIARDVSNRAKVKDIVSCLSDILTSGKKSHDSEVNIIEVLLELKRYPEVRRVIREWIPKNPIEERLRNEIVDASAENILRELKLNRKKDPKNLSVRKKVKKPSKKTKGKKKKGKKRKKTDSAKVRERRAESAGVSS